MTLLLRELERIESRAIAALRFVDAATRVPIATPLDVEVARSTLRRNGSGLYVITSAAALPGHETSFEAPPDQPPVGSVALRVLVRDPSARYLARSASIALPRDPDPSHAAQADSLFRAIDIALCAASAAPVGANWSVLRVSVAAANDAIGGALLRVIANGTVLARGMSDWRGEALVVVPGVPVTTWSDDPAVVVVDTLAAQLEVTVEPASLQRVPLADVREGKAPVTLPPADPDVLEAAIGAGFVRQSVGVQLAAGRSQSIAFALALP